MHRWLATSTGRSTTGPVAVRPATGPIASIGSKFAKPPHGVEVSEASVQARLTVGLELSGRGQGATCSTQRWKLLEQPAFGRRLRQLRQERGKSQVELTGPGMSATYLSRLESGSRRPTERSVAYLAERLGVPVESFEKQPGESLTDAVASVAALSAREIDEEAAGILVEALDTTDDADPVMRWHALAQLARCHEALGDFPGQRSVLTRLSELSDDMGRPALQVQAKLRLARCARNLGDAEAARAAVRQMLAISQEHSVRISTSDLVRSKLVLVSAEVELGDLAEAARLIDAVRESLKGTDEALVAEVLWTAATVSTRQGNHTRAFSFLLEALGGLSSRDNLILWIRLRLAAASLCMQAMPTRLAEAESFLDSVEPLLKATGPLRHWHELLFLKAKLAYHQGDADRATELVAQAEEGVQSFTYRDQVRLEVLRGVLDLKAGNHEASGRLRELVAQVETANMPDLAAEIWRTVAEVSL
ncbi:helix-turn-helix domain-containing protein [Streptomyces marianii]|uniref:Helix-turn-helix transcriptional regulator n=1 Tax=Streptomyces marianii TaxID=1817406 RepID=A0A5R9EBE5_9ACTN|nr:helix-turn-helix domain-containing protein [Streptomyces marianii]TLQ46355.1 helix-turn-helix transcriptional regulator [Streptomyces marianii]